jgi:hypothetical protein
MELPDQDPKLFFQIRILKRGLHPIGSGFSGSTTLFLILKFKKAIKKI